MTRIVLLTLAAIVALAAAASAATQALVTLTAFDVEGSVGSADLVQHTGSTCLTSICSDAFARYALGKVYVVNRFGCDNVQVLDPQNGFTTVQQFSVGNGSNPQDIALVNPRRAYVSRYGSADLWIVDPVAGTHTGTISLAAFADADGIPEAAQMLLLGGRLFVALQRLDRNNFFSPTDTSLVAVIDTATNAVVDCDASLPGTQAIVLTGTNPVTDLVPVAGGAILVGEAGAYGAMDGGVDAIDRVTLHATGFRIEESKLGGDLADLDVLSSSVAYAIVSDGSFVTHLRTFNPTTGASIGTIVSGTGYDFSCAALDHAGQILLTDRSSSPTTGVRFFDVATGLEQVTHRLTYCMPPFVIVPLEEPVTAVADAPRSAGLSLRRTAGGVRLTLSAQADAHVDVIRADGRRACRLFAGILPAGEHVIGWDRTALPRGVYEIVATAGSDRARTRAVILP